MATDLEAAIAARTALIAAISAGAAGSGVSYSIDGQSVTSSLSDAVAALKGINEMIDALGGPWEVETEVC